MKQVCIGIYCHEQPEGLRATVDSLRRHTRGRFRLVLLPDGPDAAMQSELRRYEDIRQNGTAQPLGMAACFNRLATMSRAKILVLLESGARVGPRWLEHLLRGLEADPMNGLAGPSTNSAWNEQGAFAGSGDGPEEIVRTALDAEQRFGDQVRTLAPLHSLADFCYAVRREVIEAVGAADESYSTGPCWEMDYNVRAARAGWRGVWVAAAYVHRAPFTNRRRFEEARRFEASKRLYQNKFCGARLRGEKTTYRPHCRGDACENFAPPALIEIKRPLHVSTKSSIQTSQGDLPATALSVASSAPLVTCIMPTYNRRSFVPQAVRCFLRQDYPNLELLVVDDGTDAIADCVPENERVHYLRLDRKMTIGAKRNFACEHARGEFIAHWDDDDWYPSDRVTRQIEALRDPGCNISGSSRIYYYEAASARAWEYRYPTTSAAWVGGNTLAYRKSFWAHHQFPDIQVGEDSRFVWSSRGKSICDLADPALCVATAHAENTSRKDLNGAYWHSQSREQIIQLLGDDIYFYFRTASDWPLVSCIMPTYNRRAFLPQAIQSFLQQDYPNRELIIVDDGSDRIQDLIPAAANITYVQARRRMSIGAKRNLACQQARGEFIAHWDDDDWYSPDRLRYQLAPLVTGTTDITGLENKFVLELPNGEFWTNDARLHERMFVENVHGGTLAYRKSIWTDGLRYPEINLAEDAWLLARATRSGKRLLRLANPGVFVYVRHRSNAWREFAPGSFIDPNGWQRIPRPLNFPDPALSFFLTASANHG